MEPVGRLYAGALATSQAAGPLAIPVGWIVSARNTSRAAGLCKRGCALGELWASLDGYFWFGGTGPVSLLVSCTLEKSRLFATSRNRKYLQPSTCYGLGKG